MHIFDTTRTCPVSPGCLGLKTKRNMSMAEHFGVYIDQKWAKGSGEPFTSTILPQEPPFGMGRPLHLLRLRQPFAVHKRRFPLRANRTIQGAIRLFRGLYRALTKLSRTIWRNNFKRNGQAALGFGR